jgi:hypothetical protein
MNGQSHPPAAVIKGRRTPVIHYSLQGAVPIPGLDDLLKRKIAFPLPGIEPRFFGLPNPSLTIV